MNNSSESLIDHEICLNWINTTSPDVLRTRFYLISVAASSLAAISVLENILLVLVFVIQPYFQGTHFVYLAVVAIFDVIHGISYVMTMGVGIMYEYWEDYALKNIWLKYLIPVFTLSHVMLCSSTYLLVAASLERYLTAHWLSSFCSMRGRVFAISSAIFMGLSTKGSIFFEFQVVHLEQCTLDAEYVILPTDLLRDPDYKLIWTFYYRNIVSIFLPFVLLVVLNSGIVLQEKCTVILIEPDDSGRNHIKVGFRKTPSKLHRTNSNAAALKPGKAAIMTNRWVNKAKTRVKKTATRTFVVIIVEHLLLVSLSVFIALWEFIDIQSLMDDYYDFYTIATDAVSIFTVVACAIRLPTYCICDITFRKELSYMLRGLSESCRRHVCLRARNARKRSQQYIYFRHRRGTQVATHMQKDIPKHRRSIAGELHKSRSCHLEPENRRRTSAFTEVVFEAMMKKSYEHLVPNSQKGMEPKIASIHVIK